MPVPETEEGWWEALLEDEGALEACYLPHYQLEEGRVRNEGIDWGKAARLLKEDCIARLRVKGFNRGGLLVEGDGLSGFVPLSHLLDLPHSCDEEERQAVLESYVGRDIALKVIETNPAQRRIVFSERAALSPEGKRKQLFETLKPGDIVEGDVTNLAPFGAFIDLGGVEGFAHISELSWGRVGDPCEVLQIGQHVRAMVLQVCEETLRVGLSLKRLSANPWVSLDERFREGDVLPATISGTCEYGAFARLSFGVEGLIHISSLKSRLNGRDLNELVHEGQRVMVKIVRMDCARRRLGLELVLDEPSG